MEKLKVKKDTWEASKIGEWRLFLQDEEKKSGRNPMYWEHRSLLDVQVNGIYDGYMSVATGRMVISIRFFHFCS